MLKIEHPPFDDVRDLDFQDSPRQLTMPFDVSELDSLPQPTEDDPPYRPWWVVDRP